MPKSSIPRSPKVYVVLALLFIILLGIMPRDGKFNYDYKKGSPWPYETLVAQFDFPILKTREQLEQEKEAAGSKVVPYYKLSDEETKADLKAAEEINLGDYSYIRPTIITSLNAILERGILSDDDVSVKAKDSGTPIIFIQKNKRAHKAPLSDVYTESSAQDKLLEDALKEYGNVNLDSVFLAQGVYDILSPNLVYDKETSDLVHAESVDFISPTSGFANAGQIIVTKGELVTAEIQQMLDSYKSEFENSLGYSGPIAKLWVGNGLLALSLVLILFLSIFYTNPGIFEEFNKFVYLIFIFLLAAVTAMLVEKTNSELMYMIPYSLTALYLLAFFQKRVVLPVYVISLLPLLIFSHRGLELYVIFLVAGVVTMYVFQYFNRGWRQFVTAAITFVSILLTYYGFRFINDVKLMTDLDKVLYLFIGSLLSVAGYPLIYLFEKVFNLVSNSKLQELCDTNNNKLLTDLALKAPGTFQHSLQVMNMCDVAAKSIDANVLLLRAGALYHDIGKMNNPRCFVENESLGGNYHANLSPKESARDIIRHVDDGLALAEKYGLPGIVKDFIDTHHGTSFTGYFYNKYLNAGGDPNDTADFFYHGRKPVTKEQTILMLCDTLEAASRTLKDNSQETFDAFVEKMVQIKIDAGQFEDADISIKELNIIKSVLKTYLAQIYHERVVYPNRKS